MSYSAQKRVNIGAYERPFSGVGVEYYPLNTQPERPDIILHESGYLPQNRDWNFPSVFSPFWRLYYNFKKGHCVVFGDEMTEITPEHIMLIPDRRLFHCLGKQPVPTFWLAFSLTRKLNPKHNVPVLLNPTETELCLIKDISQMIEQDPSYEPTQEIYQFSLALLNIVLCRNEISWEAPRPANIIKVEQYIQTHYPEKLTNSELAKIGGMSVEALYRTFKKSFGTTPSRYISEFRTSEASNMLLHTEMSIEEIAERTGFPTRAYFSRVFKKMTDEWPAAFRKKHKTA